MAINNPAEATTTIEQPEVTKAKRKTAGLSAPQVVHESALSSSAASANDGKLQAQTDAQSYALAYAQTTQAITPIVATHIEKARRAMSAAVSSVSAQEAVSSVGADDEDFLSGFDSGLTSLLEA